MTLEINKLATGRVRIIVTPAANKKPIAIELDQAEVALVIKLLSTAQNADDFRLSLQIGH
jgi:hypothetical protein